MTFRGRTGGSGKGGGNCVVPLQQLFVPRVICARGGMLTWFVTPFYRKWVCLGEESRSKRGGVDERRESPRLTCSPSP